MSKRRDHCMRLNARAATKHEPKTKRRKGYKHPDPKFKPSIDDALAKLRTKTTWGSINPS